MIKSKARLFGLIILFLTVGYVITLEYQMYRYAHSKFPNNVDYLIILGARVKGQTPSLSLQYRIEAAAAYMKHSPDTIAILSGGQGKGEEITEAEAMKRGLLEKGISPSRLILEEQSTSTYENIKMAQALVPSSLETGAVITNNYHTYRAIKIAEKQGLQLFGIPAKNPKIAWVKSHLREYAAITQYLVTDKMNW